MKILITGAAGFIGFHSVKRLAQAGHDIVGIDNLNDYYDVRLKKARISLLERYANFSFITLDLADRVGIASLFHNNHFDVVLHLGAQAGVRYSIENPFAYLDSNIYGTLAILEECRRKDIHHLVYASSSSVYGANVKQPFSVDDRVDSPVSLYAATKKSNELMCETYAHLYDLRCTGLRFFTVYGPWGRPDMAYFKFSEAICSGRPIDIYNNGDMERDFTYIDDIVNGIHEIVSRDPDSVAGRARHAVYNLGNNKPEKLMTMISLLEEYLGIEAKKRFLPMQPGDVLSTYADISTTERDYGFAAQVPLERGLKIFAEWYKNFKYVQ